MTSFELMDKYDKPGPRYTSYPTVPVWSKDFGERQFTGRLSRMSNGTQSPMSVYLHLPFCAARCHYCGCNSIKAGGPGSVDTYLDAVESELKLLRGSIDGPRFASHIHWGGGTPNYLGENQVKRALGMIGEAFRVEQGAEISLEADPRLGSAQQASMLREAGFNRISLGVQDVDARVQRAIGRNQSEKRTVDFYRACRGAGFESVNLDLVYGLPAQTESSFARTLEVVLGLSPDRIACFSYAHVPWARPNQESIDAALLLSAKEKFSLFQRAVKTLTGAGYEWVGIDHFAKPGDELAEAYRGGVLHRNFMGYTTDRGRAMLGLGMSGISDLLDCFAQNDSDLDGYENALAAGGLPIVRGHLLSRDDRMRRAVITHLMCNMILPFDLTEGEFGLRVDEAYPAELGRMAGFVEDGLVVIEADRLRITDMGRLFARNVCMEWDSYLAKGTGSPVFSRTV